MTVRGKGSQRLMAVLGGLVDIGTIVFSMSSLTVPVPEIYPVNGNAHKGDAITLKVREPFVKIFYCTDASLDPIEDGQLYQSPINIESSMTVVAKAKFLYKWSDLNYVDVVLYDSNEAEIQKLDQPGDAVIQLEASLVAESMEIMTEVDKTDITVYALTLNGQYKQIYDFEIEPTIIQKGPNVISVTYKGVTTTVQIIGIEPIPVELRVTSSQTQMIVDDVLDKSMFSVIAVFNDNHEEIVDDFYITPDRIKSVGVNNIEITYKGIKQIIEIEGIEKDEHFFLKPIDFSNEAAYKEYVNDAFSMFGEQYYQGFMLHAMTSLNIWDAGIESVTFNITDYGKQYETLSFVCGHLDAYESGTVDLYIYLDNTSNEPDYMFTIYSDAAPLNINIPCSGVRALKFEMHNHSITHENGIGFANMEFN